MKILILGVNGFIGNALVRRILTTRDWEVFGMDLYSNKITECLGNPRFHYLEGDIAINKEWIEYHIKKCDVVLPLVAIATPMTYVKKPLTVFELDFEENLRVVRQCVPGYQVGPTNSARSCTSYPRPSPPRQRRR